METKVTLLIIYLLLGILGSILFLIDIYKTYKELSLSDIIVFLVVALTGPITLLCLLIKYLGSGVTSISADVKIRNNYIRQQYYLLLVANVI